MIRGCSSWASTGRSTRGLISRLADVSGGLFELVESEDLLRRVRDLVQALRDAGEPAELIARIEAAADQLQAARSDRSHLAVLLEAIADIVEDGGDVADRWWLVNPSPLSP